MHPFLRIFVGMLGLAVFVLFVILGFALFAFLAAAGFVMLLLRRWRAPRQRADAAPTADPRVLEGDFSVVDETRAPPR